MGRVEIVLPDRHVFIADGRAGFDAGQARKQPDWTYEPAENI